MASENDGAGQTGPSGSPTLTRLIGWLAAAAIAVSTLVIIAISAAGPNVSVPVMPSAGGPPWWHTLHLPAAQPPRYTATFVTVSLWAALVLGCAGVIAGLVAVARGARPPVRAVMAAAFLAVAVVTALPPAGSTDTISYAANGRMAVIGHSPYVMTPLQLRRTGDPIGRQIPVSQFPSTWLNTVSVYGPVATGTEWVAAELGGSSLARITFWLKLEESLAFGAVILALDRMLRADPARRLRAHLLWSVNPLLLWEIVASGHIDGLAALFGLLGVAALRLRPGPASSSQTSTSTSTSTSQTSTSQTSTRPADEPGRGQIGLRDAALAGLAIGVATGIKAEWALFALAVAWACRRSARPLRPLAGAAAGFAVVAVPVYLAAGSPAIKVLVTRSPGVTWDTMYQLFWRPVLGYTQFTATNAPPHLSLVAYLLFAAVAVLAVWRFPDPVPDLPALAPALALSLAWLFVTAFQRPWYDVMAISLLALYSASRLDWVVLVRLLAGATVYVQAVQSPFEPHWLANVAQFDGAWLTPGIRLLATVALVWLCLSRRWGWRSESAASSGRLPELLPAT